jgi:Flp pilus assembly protein TadD
MRFGRVTRPAALAALLTALVSCSTVEEALRPQDDTTELRRINSRYEAGEKRPADQDVDAYLTKHPKSSQGQLLKGWIQFSLKNDATARLAFDKAIALDPKADNAYVGLGALARRAGQLDLARKHYNKAIDLEPKNPEAMASLVVIELKNKQYARAVAMGERALVLDPDNAVVCANLAVAYHNQGNEQKRDELFSRAKQKGYKKTEALQKIFRGEIDL